MKTNELIAVLKAYDEGKRIQRKNKGLIEGVWVDLLFTGKKDTDESLRIEHEWDFVHFDYRVKPEPHYRPFESAEEVMEAIKKHGDWLHGTNTDCIGYYKIEAVTHNGIDTIAVSPSFHFAYDMFTFLDGTPFGKMEEWL